MNKTIRQKIIGLMAPVSKNLTATDVRIGLIYTSVRLDNGNTGIAWTDHGGSEGRCREMKKPPVTRRDRSLFCG